MSSTTSVTMTPYPTPLLLTPGEVAAILGRDLSELRRWRGQNVGPTFHDLGRGLIRYARESVIESVPATTCDRLEQMPNGSRVEHH